MADRLVHSRSVIGLLDGGLRLWVVAVALLLSGCTYESSAVQRFGLELDGLSVYVWYLPCEDEVVSELTLSERDDDRFSTDGDLILWEASAEGLGAVSYSGTVVHDPLRSVELEVGGKYGLRFDSNQGGGTSGTFTVEDFEPGLVRVHGQNVTVEEFRGNAVKSC